MFLNDIRWTVLFIKYYRLECKAFSAPENSFGMSSSEYSQDSTVASRLDDIYSQILNSGEGFSLLQSISHFFPRLVSLQLPILSFTLTDSPQLPQSLVSISDLILPHYKVSLDNLHEYPALEDLDIYNRIYQDRKMLVLDYTHVMLGCY